MWCVRRGVRSVGGLGFVGWLIRGWRLVCVGCGLLMLRFRMFRSHGVGCVGYGMRPLSVTPLISKPRGFAVRVCHLIP